MSTVEDTNKMGPIYRPLYINMCVHVCVCVGGGGSIASYIWMSRLSLGITLDSLARDIIIIHVPEV